jgi:RNA polymerase sigma factor (sigma-70 family)
MSRTTSITNDDTVLDRIAASTNSDISETWQNLFQHISGYAARRISNYPIGQIDHQDIAASVFASLIRGCREGRFANVSDYEECLRLLQAMAKRKIVDRVRYLTRKKRGGDSARLETIDELSIAEVIEVCDQEMQPEACAILNEVIEDSLSHLNENLKPVIGLRLQGYEHQEIAEILNVSTSTVARKLHLVRQMWQRIIDEQVSDIPKSQTPPNRED